MTKEMIYDILKEIENRVKYTYYCFDINTRIHQHTCWSVLSIENAHNTDKFINFYFDLLDLANPNFIDDIIRKVGNSVI